MLDWKNVEKISQIEPAAHWKMANAVFSRSVDAFLLMKMLHETTTVMKLMIKTMYKNQRRNFVCQLSVFVVLQRPTVAKINWFSSNAFIFFIFHNLFFVFQAPKLKLNYVF